MLTTDDVQSLYSRFGPVSCIMLGPDAAAGVIRYHDDVHAEAAWRGLHGRSLSGIDGARLVFSTLSEKELRAAARMLGVASVAVLRRMRCVLIGELAGSVLAEVPRWRIQSSCGACRRVACGGGTCLGCGLLPSPVAARWCVVRLGVCWRFGLVPCSPLVVPHPGA